MTNEEIKFGLESIKLFFGQWNTLEGYEDIVECINDAIEAVGKSDKYGCKSCKYYDCENNYCLPFDIYCAEDFYCKIGAKKMVSIVDKMVEDAYKKGYQDAIEAVGKSDKLEPKPKKLHCNPYCHMWECSCGRFIDDEFGYCPWCGCELDWSEE